MQRLQRPLYVTNNHFVSTVLEENPEMRGIMSEVAKDRLRKIGASVPIEEEEEEEEKELSAVG